MRKIIVNYNSEKGRMNRYSSLCIGAGRAGEVLRNDFQTQLGTASRECGFKYIRFHGIFHEDMGVYREDKDGNPLFNWQYVDVVYDSILEKGMKPFVELGFMPKEMASDNLTVFWWASNITPPKDYNKWYLLIRSFVEHLEERYGREEILTWYFEVWNEPNHPGFFSTTKVFNDVTNINEYFKLYDTAANAVKDVCEDYRVGGPATAGNGWINEIIQHCYVNKVPLDFVSTHTYGIIPKTDADGIEGQYLADDKDFIIKDIQNVHNQVKASPLPELEIHYTEWNTSWYNKDYIHDSYIQAPCVLYNLKRMEGFTDTMSYWTFTDIFEESGPPPTPFHGGFGLMNLQGIKKPAYYAFKFMAELGDVEVVNQDADSWACKDDSGFQLLLWNYTKPEQDVCDEKYYSRDLPSTKLENVSVKIEGLPKGSYSVEVFKVGYGCNDPFTHYIKMGAPNYLNRAQANELSSISSGKAISLENVEIEVNGSFEKELSLRENDVYFIKLLRI
jgi:xylan 1,4-beta-xylosidase